MPGVATHLPVRRARQLRKDGTDAENRHWYVLRNRNFDSLEFVRQMPIGPYFADFACREAALIVEIDGGQHADSEKDIRRTAFLLAIREVIAGNPSPDLRFAPATLSPTGRGTRGARAARVAIAAQISREAPPFPLPVGERVDRPKAETGEGFSSTQGE